MFFYYLLFQFNTGYDLLYILKAEFHTVGVNCKEPKTCPLDSALETSYHSSPCRGWEQAGTLETTR